MEHGALQICEQDFHKALAVRQTCFAERAADVANETDGDRCELVLLVRVERVDEERQEGLQVGVELLVESRRHCAHSKECILENRRLLSGRLNQL